MNNEENALFVKENNNLTVTDRINETIKRYTLDLQDEDNAILYNVLTSDTNPQSSLYIDTDFITLNNSF